MLVPKTTVQSLVVRVLDCVLKTKRHLERPEHKLVKEVSMKQCYLVPHNPYALYTQMVMSYFENMLKKDAIVSKDLDHLTLDDKTHLMNMHTEGNKAISDSWYFYNITYLPVGSKTLSDVMRFSEFIYSDLFSDDEIGDAFLKCYFEKDCGNAVISVEKSRRFIGGIMDIPIVKEDNVDCNKEPLPI